MCRSTTSIEADRVHQLHQSLSRGNIGSSSAASSSSACRTHKLPYKRTCLPEGAQVGTVDRFQGQEAAIVVISMATSSGDDLLGRSNSSTPATG